MIALIIPAISHADEVSDNMQKMIDASNARAITPETYNAFQKAIVQVQKLCQGSTIGSEVKMQSPDDCLQAINSMNEAAMPVMTKFMHLQ